MGVLCFIQRNFAEAITHF